jgi:hypothetical protein
VQKRDEVPVRPEAGFLVDQVYACGGEPGQLGRDVVRAVGNVMEALAPAFEKATDRGIG